MNPFLSHLSTRVDATAADLKTSLHEHVDSTVDSRLDTCKLEPHQQQMDCDDADTNAHNVTVNIKTEPMDCDFVVVKEEIKEEDDHDDDCDGCDRCLVKPKLESDDDDRVDNHGTLTNQTVTVKTEWNDEEVKEEIKEEIKEEYEDDHKDDCDGCERCLVKKEEVTDDDEVDNEGGLIRGGDNDEVDDERFEVTQANVDCGQLLSNPSRDRKNDSNANESIEVCVANLSRDRHNTTTLNEPNEVTTVTQSAQTFSPQTSTGHGSSRTALDQQATASTGQNATKRKQPTSNGSAKKSKKTLQNDDDGEDGEDIANEDRKETKVKVLHLDCTESDCNVKLDSLAHLYVHLRTVHRLAPLQCFATNCNARFEPRHYHIELSHSRNTRFLCPVCSKQFNSQPEAYLHWYQNHLTGQYKCNFVGDCGEVTDTRNKMRSHQQAKHEYQSKHFICTHPGCTSSFAYKAHLKQHKLTHLDSKPFHCSWLQCNHRTKQRANLIRHIRTQHFGLPESVKAQKDKNIWDERDPNEYVRVVVDDVE